nr:exportin-4-like isoform X2 [Nomia melanderi]
MNSFEQIINELEKAAQVILVSPNLITTEQRRSAEEVFLNFRKTKSPYQLCQQILETNTNDYILFETAGLLKLALTREWSSLSNQDICSLKQYLLNYLINKPHLTTYVKGNILQVIAIIIKNGRLNDSGQKQQEFLNEIENLIMTGDLPKKVLGCNLISALLQEYALDKSLDLDLDLDFILDTGCNERKEFINVTLKRIFKFSLEIFNELIKKDISEETLVLLKYLLPIVESILTWQFSYANETVELFFTLYWKIRGNLQVARSARTCLVQLASLGGPIFSSKEIRAQYFSNYIRRFLEFITNIDVIDEEASAIADIVSNLTRAIHENIVSLPEDILKAFLEQICRLICLYIENSAQEEFLCSSECSYSEGLDVLFATWIHITSRNTPDTRMMRLKTSDKLILVSDGFVKPISMQIFNVYLQCHLCTPDGIRNLKTKELNQKDDDTEDDKVRFKEQLQAIGYCGRQALNHSLSLLSHLIRDRTCKLHENFNNLVRHIESLHTLNNAHMARLYEDIHWLLLVTAHVLCMESTGEIALIPTEIIKYSMEQANQGKINVDLTLQLLVASEDVSSDMNVAIESIDHVIHFVTNIFRLCAIEKTAISVGLGSVLSPVLSCTIVWFLQRWSFSYLLPREKDYFEISPTFLEVFGEDSHGALWAINFLLDKIEYNINSFRSEPTIMQETIELLISLVTSKSKAIYILKSVRYKSIWNLAVKERHDFSPEVKRGLTQAVIQCEFVGLHLGKEKDEKEEENYWARILHPLGDRCMQIMSDEKFLKSYHREEIKVQIIDTLDRLIGVVQGCEHSMQSSGILIQCTYPILEKLPQLLSLYHNYQEIVELILELLYKVSKPTLFLQSFELHFVISDP